MLTAVSHSILGWKTICLFFKPRFFLVWNYLDSMPANDKSCFRKNHFLRFSGKPEKGKLRHRWVAVYSLNCVLRRDCIVFWWDCIVVADSWSNNPGHSGLALSGWRSLYYWIPALFTAPLTSAYCCSSFHPIQTQRSRQPMSISWPSFASNIWIKSSATEFQPYLEELSHIY